MSTRGCGRLSERVVLGGDLKKVTADRWVTRTLGIEAGLPRCVAIALSFRRLVRLHGGYFSQPTCHPSRPASRLSSGRRRNKVAGLPVPVFVFEDRELRFDGCELDRS